MNRDTAHVWRSRVTTSVFRQTEQKKKRGKEKIAPLLRLNRIIRLAREIPVLDAGDLIASLVEARGKRGRESRLIALAGDCDVTLVCPFRASPPPPCLRQLSLRYHRMFCRLRGGNAILSCEPSRNETRCTPNTRPVVVLVSSSSSSCCSFALRWNRATFDYRLRVIFVPSSRSARYVLVPVWQLHIAYRTLLMLGRALFSAAACSRESRSSASEEWNSRTGRFNSAPSLFYALATFYSHTKFPVFFSFSFFFLFLVVSSWKVGFFCN